MSLDIIISSYIVDLLEDHGCDGFAEIEMDHAVGVRKGHTQKEHERQKRKQSNQRWGELSKEESSASSHLLPRLPRSSSDNELIFRKRDDHEEESRSSSTMPRRNRLSQTSSFDSYDPFSKSTRRRRRIIKGRGHNETRRERSTLSSSKCQENFVWALSERGPPASKEEPSMTVVLESASPVPTKFVSRKDSISSNALIGSPRIECTRLDQKQEDKQSRTEICGTSPTSTSQFSSVFDDDRIDVKRHRDSLTLPIRRPFRKLSISMEDILVEES